MVSLTNISNLNYEDTVNSGNDVRNFIIMQIRILSHLMRYEKIGVLNDNLSVNSFISSTKYFILLLNERPMHLWKHFVFNLGMEGVCPTFPNLFQTPSYKFS